MSPTDVAIDAMTLVDLPRVLAIERASFKTPWTEENFRHEIENNPLAWNLVARRGGRVVAFACVYVVADEVMINDVATEPEERRGGLARTLLRHVLDGASVRGCRRATLEVRPSNAAARSLYEAFGFVTVGRRPGYYSDSGEDALLMERPL